MVTVHSSWRTLLGGFLTVMVTACGGGGSSSSGINQQPINPGPAPQAAGLLKSAANDEELADALREGMARNNALGGAPLDFAAPIPGLSLENESFSVTNLQEAGVDEADLIKYDGELLYVSNMAPDSDGEVATGPELGLSLAPPLTLPTVSIYRTDVAAPAIERLSTIEFDQEDGLQNLYLRASGQQQQLVSVSERFSITHWGILEDFTYWQNQQTRIRGWNVDNPADVQEQFSFLIEGGLLTTRRIDNVLYVITRYAPLIEGVQPYPSNEEEVTANAQLLNDVAPGELFPEVSRDGQPAVALVGGEDCYIPNTEHDGPRVLAASSSMIVVTAIDLDAPDNLTAICLNGFVGGFYVSMQNLYLTTHTQHDTTLIHKVALNEGQPEYRGSGEVVGYLGTSNPSFLMSEHGDDLRVISSVWQQDVFPLPLMPDVEPAPADTVPVESSAEEEIIGRHQLTVLRENATTVALEQVARLPNAERPAPIGKPGEDLYAARFLDDKVYVVTFEVIDPLYVIDLSTPTDPRIEGELEIPGFSTYLQPLENGLLLGIGSEVSEEVALTEGVKVALFDVSDTQNPVELDSEVIGKRGTFGPALYDYQALSLLGTSDGYRLAMPVQRHERLRDGGNPNDPFEYYDWSDSSLYQFDIDAVGGSITTAGKLVVEQYSGDVPFPSFGLDLSRSVLHEDAVFFTVFGQPDVYVQRWGGDQSAGP